MEQRNVFYAWSLFCGDFKNSTVLLVNNSICIANGLAFLTNATSLILLSVFVLCSRGTFKRTQSLPHLRYPGHVIRWILCFLLILSQTASLTEGILTDFRYGFIQWHLSLPEAAAVMTVILALKMATVIERINRGNLFVLLTVIWMLSGVVESIRVASFMAVIRPDLTLVRLDVMLLSSAIYFVLALLDAYTFRKLISDSDLTTRRQKLIFELEKRNVRYYQRYSTLIGQCTLTWLYGLLQSREKDSLTDEDIGNLPRDTGAATSHRELEICFKTEQNAALDSGRSFSLKRVLVWFTYQSLVFSGFLQLLSEICSYVQPLGVKGIIQWVTRASPSYEVTIVYEGSQTTIKSYFQNGAVLVGVMFLTQVLQRTLQESQRSVCIELSSKTSSGLKCMLYERLLSLSSHLVGCGAVTVGEVTNHMAQDTFSVEQFLMQIHSSWTTPLRIVVSMVLLYCELDAASIVVMLIMLLSIPLQFILGRLTSKYKSRVMETRDSRIKRSGEMIQGIRYLKLSGWENSFCNSIKYIRNEEMKGLFNMQLVFIARKILTSSVPIVTSAALFAFYSLLSGMQLTPASAFFALTIIQQTQLPLTNFSLFFESLASTTVSVNRFEAFFQHSQKNQKIRETVLNEENAIEIQNGHFTWGDDTNQAILKDINIQIPKGQLTMVIGPVGSGKSSLLNAILGEMTTISGSTRCNEKVPTIAYSSQRAWILNASLQKNIILDEDGFASNRYFTVLTASALEQDIAILPAGDRTEIGEKGVNISGGQQQRVSIARTLYSGKDIVLLDDPLSALDVHVGKHVFHEGILNTLRNNDKTVVLVTHQIQYVSYADKVILMDSGRIRFSGTPGQLQVDEPDVLSVLENSQAKCDEIKRKRKTSLDGAKPSRNAKEYRKKGKRQKHQRGNVDGEKAKLIKPEERKRGRIAWSVYCYYVIKCGLSLVGLVLISRVIDASLILAAQFWLSAWSEAANYPETDENTIAYYVTGYVTLSGFGIISSLMATTTIVYTAYSGSRRLHETVLRNIARLPIRFFDVTPVGRILNRLSQDTMQLDELMVRWVEGFIATSTAVLVTLITNVIVFPPICVAFLPLGYIFYRILLIYLGPARDLKRFESVNRSPYLSLASETVNGLESIRAFRIERDLFHRFCHQVDKHYVVNLYSRLAAVWVTLRLAYLAAVISACISICAVVASLFLQLEASLVGLAIAVSLSLPNDMQRWMQVFAQLEIGMNAVERQKYYSEMETEKYEGKEPPFYWLCEGSINIQGITVKYEDHLDPALRDVSFSIEAGQKVGICGRTGSGKSTLTLCLLRMLTPEKGRILIDGIDIASIPLTTLRSRVSIIPQDPTLFSGTVRSCLDMDNRSNDQEIWRALKLTNMANKIVSLEAGLDSIIDFGGSNFSLGEKQLLCLARAIIRNSQIIIMDEATASIDTETDDTVRKVVGELFQNKTVITVAHRLSSIMDADVIVVLSNGEIAESGSSSALLSQPGSIFSSMVRDGN